MCNLSFNLPGLTWETIQSSYVSAISVVNEAFAWWLMPSFFERIPFRESRIWEKNWIFLENSLNFKMMIWLNWCLLLHNQSTQLLINCDLDKVHIEIDRQTDTCLYNCLFKTMRICVWYWQKKIYYLITTYHVVNSLARHIRHLKFNDR